MKNDHAHGIRLTDALAAHVGLDAAKEFEEKYPLSKSANIEKKFQWANAVCAYLEEHFDTDTILAIRRECRCNDGASIAARLRKYRNQAASTEEFVSRFNQSETFASLTYLSDHRILFSYPECYCACVKRIPRELSKTWCYCTLGNAEEIFRRVFDKEVRVTLLETIKSGADRCVIAVEW